jgi:hypothetical protein
MRKLVITRVCTLPENSWASHCAPRSRDTRTLVTIPLADVDGGILRSLDPSVPRLCLVGFSDVRGEVAGAAFGRLELSCLRLLLLRGTVRLLLGEALVEGILPILRGRIEAGRHRYIHLLTVFTLNFCGIRLPRPGLHIGVGGDVIPREVFGVSGLWIAPSHVRDSSSTSCVAATDHPPSSLRSLL